MAGNNWIPIESISGAATDYSFTSIPAGYKSLILKGLVQSSNSAYVQEGYLRCNNDTGNNYADSEFGYHSNYSTVKHAMTDSVSGGTAGFIGGSYLGDWMAQVDIHIIGNDASNRYTQWVGTSAMGGGSNGYNVTMFGGGLWKDMSVVTQLDTFAFNFNSNSVLTLYGRK